MTAHVRARAHAHEANRVTRHHPPPLGFAHDLTRLAAAVVRLSPSHRDPERFHEDKDAIAAELRRLARVLA